MIEGTRSQNSRLIDSVVFESFLPYQALDLMELYGLAKTDPVAMTLFALALNPQMINFFNSQGMQVDRQSTYFDRAIAMGALEPRYFKAVTLVHGDDAKEVGIEALQLIEPLISRKHPPSLHAAAGIYKKNLGDLVTAEKYYLEAAELGSGQSYIDLAGMILYNNSTRQSDIDRAISYYDTAIEKTQTKDAVRAAVRASFAEPQKFTTDKLVKLLLKHSERGDFDCSQAILEVVSNDCAPTSVITPLILEHAMQLVKLRDHSIILALYGYIEKSGLSGLMSVDELISICGYIINDPFFEDRGKGNAAEVRGKIDLNGLSKDANLERACKFFEFGEVNFNSGRCGRYYGYTLLKLGRYSEGLEKAVELMQEGDPESMALVGYCLLEGKGCPKDTAQGAAILQQARQRGAKLGSPFA